MTCDHCGLPKSKCAVTHIYKAGHDAGWDAALAYMNFETSSTPLDRPREAVEPRGQRMPKETFWSPLSVEGDESEPIVIIEWRGDVPGVYINGVRFDRSGVNRLINTLRKARNQTDGKDA